MIPILLLAPLLLAPEPPRASAQEPPRASAPEPGKPIDLQGAADAQGAAAARDATDVTASIAEVTVYPGSAVVRRRATLPAASGRFAVRGLPRRLDPDALRVRAEGAEIVGVELRERVARVASDARIEELRTRVADVERRLAANGDAQGVVQQLSEHVERLLVPALGPDVGPGATGAAPSLERWAENLAYLEARMTELHEQDRALTAEARELKRRLGDLRLELGSAGERAGVATFDLVVDAFALAGAARAVLEVDYVVPDAGWAPVYDLRAPKDLANVELVYRARVHQQTGEDWRDVALLLSTAEPRRGAQGPEPEARWVGVSARRGRIVASEAPRSEAPRSDLGLAGDAPESVPSAGVEDEGLSLRFRLPSRETIESRREPTTVLVGRAVLALQPEHYCIPALDPTVWLRAEARNTSDYVLLPGRAAVYLGADFLGHADLKTVHRDETFLLPLGPDPGVSVERVQLADETGERGVFRSKRTLREAWRVELKNHGAFGAGAAVDVIVHEALPKGRDDRIAVELKDVRPKLAEGERWKTLREEKSALTWIVRVPRGGAATVEHTLEIAYPADLDLVRRMER